MCILNAIRTEIAQIFVREFSLHHVQSVTKVTKIIRVWLQERENVKQAGKILTSKMKEIPTPTPSAQFLYSQHRVCSEDHLAQYGNEGSRKVASGLDERSRRDLNPCFDRRRQNGNALLKRTTIVGRRLSRFEFVFEA